MGVLSGVDEVQQHFFLLHSRNISSKLDDRHYAALNHLAGFTACFSRARKKFFFRNTRLSRLIRLVKNGAMPIFSEFTDPINAPEISSLEPDGSMSTGLPAKSHSGSSFQM